jgi:hypothetical protein
MKIEPYLNIKGTKVIIINRLFSKKDNGDFLIWEMEHGLI